MTPGHSALATAWLAEALERIEETGALDDTQELARAQRAHTDPAQQLAARTWLLAERLGLVTQLARWREAAWLLLVLGAAAVLALANGLVFAVLAEGRTINAAGALVSALGLHLLTLLLWLASLVRSGGASGAVLSLGRVLAVIALRLASGRGPHADALAQGGLHLLARERLAVWAFGGVGHVVWTLGFVFLLGGLLWAFAFRAYALTWETTILGPEWFSALARATGALPAWLGAPVPVPAEGATAGVWPARQAAWWLLSCVALYGLLPRALCALWCWLVLRRAARRVALPLGEPYYQRLLARLRALEPAEVTDPEQPHAAPSLARGQHSGAQGVPTAVVGFELPAGAEWPPQPLADGAAWLVRIAGSMDEQAQVQAELARLQPRSLVVVCDAQASPDRGTARFLREAAASAGRSALLLGAPAAEGAQAAEQGVQRWRAWVLASRLDGWRVFDHPAAAAQWAAGSDPGTAPQEGSP